MDDIVDTFQCPNCSKIIPESNRFVHTFHCRAAVSTTINEKHFDINNKNDSQNNKKDNRSRVVIHSSEKSGDDGSVIDLTSSESNDEMDQRVSESSASKQNNKNGTQFTRLKSPSSNNYGNTTATNTINLLTCSDDDDDDEDFHNINRLTEKSLQRTVVVCDDAHDVVVYNNDDDGIRRKSSTLSDRVNQNKNIHQTTNLLNTRSISGGGSTNQLGGESTLLSEHRPGTNNSNSRNNNNSRRRIPPNLTRRANTIVDRVLGVIHNYCATTNGVYSCALEKHDLIWCAERLLQKQKECMNEGIDSHIDICYHYTSETKLRSIRNNGLITRSRRNGAGDIINSSEVACGEGIYTGETPFTSLCDRGDFGLILARLKGLEMPADRCMNGFTKGNNSITNETPFNETSLVVLQGSDQCIPLLKYPKAEYVLGENNFSDICLIMEQTVNQYFNANNAAHNKSREKDLVSRTSKSNYRRRTSASDPEALDIRPNKSMKKLLIVHQDDNIDTDVKKKKKSKNQPMLVPAELLRYNAPETLENNNDRSFSLLSLGFGEEPCGPQPSGTLEILYLKSPCLGFCDTDSSIVLEYTFPQGHQKSFHPNPGCGFRARKFTAYLPENMSGKRLLGRLKRAFLCGLTFEVGECPTTRNQNSIIWGGIPHKTSLDSSGSNTSEGYPDPGYLERCNDALDRILPKHAFDLSGLSGNIIQPTCLSDAVQARNL